ncbi:MAG: DUF5686 family protein [Bacteroidales bacterium]|nr:DUF5686 family protein [Bacteroidales bacterium]
MLKKTIIFIILISQAFCTYSQNKLSGRITDAKGGEALAFVNIIYNSSNQGTTSDLDGYFHINSKEKIEFLKISYLGYQAKTVSQNEITKKSYIEISLDQDAYQLDEVTILPGINPAHRIINAVIENSDKNNPEKMRSFSYISYNKMYFTIDTRDIERFSKDTVPTDSVANDTIKPKKTMMEFFDEQHLFITESVAERKFKYPDNNQEDVLAHKMSGLKTPAFTLLTSQFQSFSFYKDFINLLDKKYLSPISKGSTNKYFFLIEDTMYNEAADTIFIISYRPLKGKNFEGLQGVLHVNSHGYAIQNVNAKPYEPTGAFNINIQQKYDLIDSVQWFPVQLNTDLVMNILQIGENSAAVTTGGTSSNYLPLVGIGKSYISDISLNPDYKRREFSQIGVVVSDGAAKKDSVFWSTYRKDTLTAKDKRTYKVIDSIGKEANLDRAMDVVDIIAAGYIPIKFVNLDPTSLLWYNQYEGYRTGLSLATNHKMLKWMSIGGYVGYGFRDKALKYGGSLEFILDKKATTRLKLGYKQDLEFSDEHHFYNDIARISLQSTRDFFLSEMDSIQLFYGSFKFSALRYLQADLRFDYQNKNIINPDRYSFYEAFPLHYCTSEVGLYVRYAYKEKFLQTPKGNLLSMGTKHPVIYANIIKGIEYLDGEYDYLKLEAKISKKFAFRHIGDSYLTLSGAYLDGHIPYGEMYYGTGSYSWLNIDNSFNTMRINEFISDRFASVYFRHDFGSLLFKTPKWQPKIVIVSAAGWGDNTRITNSDNTDFAKTMNKGYFESGIQLNQILKMSFNGFGLGVYYRYGPYSRTKEIENWAFKLNLTFVL